MAIDRKPLIGKHRGPHVRSAEFAHNDAARRPCLVFVETPTIICSDVLLLYDRLGAFRDLIRHDKKARLQVDLGLVSFGGFDMATAFATAESFSPPSRPMQFNIDVEAAAVAGAEMLMKRRLAYQRNEIAFYRPWVFRFGLEATIESVSEAARYIVSGETMRSYTFRAEGLKAADLETLARDLEIPIGSLWEVAVTNWLSS